MAQVLLPPLLAAVLLVGGGCAADAPPSASERVPRSPASSSAPESTSTPAPTAEPGMSPSGKVGRVSKGDKGVDGQKMEPPSSGVARATSEARTHLLTAEAVPAIEGAGWAVVATRLESDPVGACQRASLVDIGALRAVVRVFEGPEGSGLRSSQVVARFADKKSAWRAHEVLRSWRDRCEELLDGAAAEVGPMVEVDLPTATGAHYRADHGPKKDADHTGLGIVRHHGWISIVDITATETDYPAAWTRKAVRRIAATF